MPYLQFWTYWGRFYVRVESEDERFVKTDVPAGEGLKRYAILDRHGDFAGLILLDAAWSDGHDGEEMNEFIAISDAREFDESEYGYWNSYVEEDQSAVPWQLYNVLMTVRDDPNAQKNTPDNDVAFRTGLGKTYKQAFENACQEEPDENGKDAEYPAWKEIILG